MSRIIIGWPLDGKTSDLGSTSCVLLPQHSTAAFSSGPQQWWEAAGQADRSFQRLGRGAMPFAEDLDMLPISQHAYIVTNKVG